MSQQQTMMKERFQKAKWEQFCAHFNNNLKVFLNFDENQWTIETKQRKTGHSEGSFDAYYLFCAEEKRGKTKRFRSLKEVERKLREDARETKEKKTSTEKHSSSSSPPPPPKLKINLVTASAAISGYVFKSGCFRYACPMTRPVQ
mmetsp:Transcript_9174/g.29588  ORF Transcript_9174/g.29588 Transcript_9174/m.29588 type:complete len:145 (-) Transcript_9174:195-629(-)